MYIGQLAALTGASRKAIRLYESLGLIPEPQRRGTYRVYEARHVHLVQMIRRSQAVGFTLADMVEIMTLKATTGRFPVALARRSLDEKLARLRDAKRAIEQNEQTLRAMSAELEATYGATDLSEPCA